jgi:hypothetical protein
MALAVDTSTPSHLAHRRVSGTVHHRVDSRSLFAVFCRVRAVKLHGLGARFGGQALGRRVDDVHGGEWPGVLAGALLVEGGGVTLAA